MEKALGLGQNRNVHSSRKVVSVSVCMIVGGVF